MRTWRRSRRFIEGCLKRFRPIMMTTMAALLGTLPIAIGGGAGGEARRPLGTGGSRRVVGFAGADALYYPGDLSLLGAIPEKSQRVARNRG